MNLVKIGVVVFVITFIIMGFATGLFTPSPTGSSAAPDCTNTTIDKYYPCASSTPIMLRSR